MRSRVLGSDGKRLHLFHAMTNLSSGAVIATGEHMLLHVDAKAEKACPAPDAIAAAMLALVGAQQSLAPPEGTGRSIKMPG